MLSGQQEGSSSNDVSLFARKPWTQFPTGIIVCAIEIEQAYDRASNFLGFSLKHYTHIPCAVPSLRISPVSLIEFLCPKANGTDQLTWSLVEVDTWSLNKQVEGMEREWR